MTCSPPRPASGQRSVLLAALIATVAVVASSAVVMVRPGTAARTRVGHEVTAAGSLATASLAPERAAAPADSCGPESAGPRRVAFGGSGPVLDARRDAPLGHLTPEQHEQVEKLVKKLEKYEHLRDMAAAHVADFQAKLDAAQQALLDALAMPEGTPAEIKAKQAAVKKAHALLDKFGKKLAKWTASVANYATLAESFRQQIIAIDPGFAPGDGPTSWAPEAPEDLVAHAAASSVTLEWSPSDTATTYDLFWSTWPGLTLDEASRISGVASPFVHANLTKGQTYWYIVTASNGEGMSEPSQVVSAHVQAAASSNANSLVGMNFTELSYYSAEWVFTDAMKQSMRWLPQETSSATWDTGHPLQVDALGWPILGTNPSGKPEAAGTLMYRDLGGHYPAGQYVCRYDGEGTIEFGFDAHVVSQTPGRIVVAVDAPTNNGIYLKIAASNPANRVRNVRLMLPGFENSAEVFHPLFKQRLAPFKVLRFMKWQRTNSEKVPVWSQRTLPAMQTQDQKDGVALEHMIDLCNEMDADPWLCVRVTADDAFVTQMATLIRDRLASGLKVYIEHGNEIWNGMFPDFQYCIDKGVALGYDGNGAGEYLAGLRYHSERSVQIFGIFETVFGGAGRLVRVLGAQGANPWAGVQVMDWKDAWQHADALAGANYFGWKLDADPNVVNMSVQQILDFCANDIATVENDFVAQNAANAHQRGLKFVGYEAGQHLTGVGPNLTNDAVTAKFIAANRDPGMYALYQQCFNGWEQNGGDMCVAFSSCGPFSVWGCWGAMEHQDQDTSPDKSPKYAALVDFIAQQQAGGP